MRLRATTLILLGLAAAALASCGSDDEQGNPIPADVATQLESRLVEIQNRFDFGGGACADITGDSEPAVNDIIESLPGDTDADVRDALQKGFDRLFELSTEQCDEQQGQETTPEEPEEPDTDTTETTPPPETETDTTDTVPPETTPEEPVDPTIPPDEGEEDGESGGSGGVIGPGMEG